jgi:hypothetical protein
MENTQKSAPAFQNIDGKKFDVNLIGGNFMASFMPAWELFKKDPVNFILVFALPVVIGAVLSFLIVPLLLGSLLYGNLLVAGLVTLVFVILSALFQFYAYGCALRAIVDREKKGKIDFKSVLMFVKDHFADAVKLGIKVFMFTGAWIPLAVALAGAVLAALGLLPLAALAFTAFPIVGIVVFIVNFKKFVNSSFALLYFYESESPKVEDSLKASLNMAEGKTWTLFWNYIMIGLATGVVSAIISSILFPIFRPVTADTSFASSLASAVIGSFTVIFQYMTKWNAEKISGHKQ